MDVGFAPSQGKRVRWDGLEVASLDDLRGRSQVFIFVPESLLLVKGSPARRRAHLDAFAAALDPQYAAAARDVQGVLRQRNAQLAAVKNGADPAALDPWDAQFARVAAELGRRRRELVGELAAEFAEVASALAPADERFTLRLVAQLESVAYDAGALLEELRARRPGEVSRGLSLFGPHRDDLKFLEVGADGAGVSRGCERIPPHPAPPPGKRLRGSRPWSAGPSAVPSSYRAADATCGCSGRRENSGRRSWRCSWPNSGSPRRALGSRAPSSSTTS